MNILTISDMHIPYHHPDALEFLKHLKKKYKPDLVVNLGDMLDFHNISFHDSDPNLLSAGDELSQARKYIKQVEKIFPNMIIIGSNHGDLPLRKFLAAGLPKSLIRPYHEIYGVSKNWKFVDDLTIEYKGIPDIYFAHGIRKNALSTAQQRGQCFIQGHFHESFNIQYCGNPHSLLWAVTAGCLIDRKSLAFNYNKLNLNRPIIGTAVIMNGQPILEPMLLSRQGNWLK